MTKPAGEAPARPASTEPTEIADGRSMPDTSPVSARLNDSRAMWRAAGVADAPVPSPPATRPADLGERETAIADRKPVSRRRWTDAGLLSVLSCTFIGALVVGGIGFVSAARDHRYTASALISVQPDPSPLNAADNGSSDAQDRFVQSQVLVFNSTPLQQEVTRKLALGASSSISASQVGTTNTVKVTGTSTSARSAVALADAATGRYMAAHSAAADERANAAASAVEQQLARVRTGLVGTVGSLDPQRNPLEAEYARLLSLQSQIALARSEADRSVISVTTAGAAGARRVTPPTQRAALLALLGAMLGLGTSLLWRAKSPRVLTTGMVNDLDPAPVLPHMSRAAAQWRRTLGEGRPASGVERAVRLQAGHLTRGTEPLGRPPVLVISASRGTGTSFTALNLALEAARRHPTVLIWAGDLADEQTAASLGVAAVRRDMVDVSGGPWTVTKLRTAVVDTRIPGLFVLPMGAVAEVEGQYRATPVRLSGGRYREEQVESAIANGLLDAVIASGWGCVVDCPPPAESRVGLSLAARNAQVVFVVGLGVSTQESVVDSLHALRRAGATISGLIVNRPPVRRWRLWHRYRRRGPS
jgi:Mrp family chromosome partitioning ATPase